MATTDAIPALEFPEGFRGEVIRPGDPGYDDARAVVNGMIDKRPAIIVRPTCSADIIDAVNLARENGIPLGVRCGGHSVAGNGAVEGGVLIDLSSLKGVHVDPKTKRARANAGVLWGEFDRETQLYGLATPGGRVTSTGIGGFTTGGGYGWLSPVHGLTCDNLVSAEVVTADGRLVTASETENPDLFWGIRGGSSNFGIVTSFEYQLHPVGPMVLAGLILHPIAKAKEVAKAYRDIVEAAPEELVTALAIVMAPPAPFVPEEMHGKPVFGMVVFYVGDSDEGAEVARPLKELGTPIADVVGPMPYTAFQAMLDPFAPTGWQNYHGGMHMASLPDEAIDAYVDAGTQTLSPMTQAILFRHGGAVSRVPDDATAASHRSATYMAHPIAQWQDPKENATHIAWCKDFAAAMAPYTTGGVYLNFEQDPSEQHVRRGYDADKYARLVALKDTWDPTNLFSVNQNIRPSGSAPVEVPGQRVVEVEKAAPQRS